MSIKNNIRELIGNTPMLKLNNLKKELNLKSDIIVKIESFNPMSSVKDRIGLSLISDALKKGLINEDTTLVEATSGNTGIALAYISASLGLKLIIVMPETMTIERRKLISAFGAKIVLTEGSKGMKGAISKVEELVNNNSNYYSLKQFENEANPLVHERTTAVEIINDTNLDFDYFIAGIGTGGTISGVAKVLKDKKKEIKIIGVEPTDSPVISKGYAGPHKIQGIGAGFIPKTLNVDLIDEIITIENEEAFSGARLLAKTEGVLVGISSGAALSAAIKLAKEVENKKIVVILPDTGERYLSTTLYEI